MCGPSQDPYIPPGYWKEAIVADDELIEARSDASPTALLACQELARRAPNRDPNSLGEHDLDREYDWTPHRLEPGHLYPSVIPERGHSG